MGKTAANIEHYLDPKNDKEYLKDLLFGINNCYLSKETVTFMIVAAKRKGFLVKVGGLFAYISFNHFAWSYPSIEFWRNAAKSMVGHYFTGKIYKVQENPISIQVDAKGQKFNPPNLIKYAKYRGVVLRKTNYGFFVDLGGHFHWKFGAIVGLVHNATFLNGIQDANWKVGDEIETLFQGYNDKNQPILGDNRDHGKWSNGELLDLIGTIQRVTVKLDEDKHPTFYVLNAHEATIPIKKEFYPGFRTRAKKYLYSLKDRDVINCEVVKINSKKNSFVLKLCIDPPAKSLKTLSESAKWVQKENT